MKAVRLHKFHTQPVIDEVPEPKISGPLDVIVKIGGAGVCRTDLHIIEGQWDAAMGTPLPYILGHENAGWVHEIGSGGHERGRRRHRDPAPTGHLRAVPRLPGRRRHALREQRVPRPEPGRRDGRVPADLGPGLYQAEPGDPSAGRGRAGRRRHHRLPRGAQGPPAALSRHHLRGHRRRRPRPHRRAVPGHADARPTSSWSTATRTRSSWPSSWGARHTVVADGTQVDAVKDLTGGKGAHVVLDFVAEQGAEMDGWNMTARGRLVLRYRLRRQRCTSRRWTSSPPSATSSATSSEPTTSWPS